MSATTVNAVGAMPGARTEVTAGNRPLRVREGEVAVVVEGTVDVFFVAADESGAPLTPAFVAERSVGEVVTGDWWLDPALGLPQGEGLMSGVGEAKVLVATGDGGEPLAAAVADWRAAAARFAAAGPIRRRDAERERLDSRRELERQLERDSERALVRVLEAVPLERRPAGVDPLVAALARAAASSGGAPERERLEQLTREPPASGEVVEVAALLRVPVRRVTLGGSWWTEPTLPLVAFRDGEPLALLPRGRGFVACDANGPRERVTAELAKGFDQDAYAVYPRLASGGVSVRELLRVGFAGTRRSMAALLGLTAITGGLGAFIPYATAQILGVVIPSGNRGTLDDMLIAIAAFTVAALAASIAQSLLVLALGSRSSAALTPAVWHRVLHVSPAFFRGRSAGDVMQQATAFDQMRALMSGSLVAALAGSALVVAATALLFVYSVDIALVVLVTFAALLGGSLLALRAQGRWLQAVIEERNRLNGLVLGFFAGISKLRVAGAERRAHALWARGYAFQEEAQRKASLQTARLTVLQGMIPGALLLAVLVAIAAFNGGDVPLVEFTGSVAAAGQLAGAAASIIAVAGIAVQLLPLYRSARPILDTPLEVRGEAAPPGEVTGAIELDRVTFGYREGAPVLNEVSIAPKPGSFTAIVGPSGAGKSTVLRMILGFETPWEGEVLLDGKPLRRLDLEAVRRRMGTVIQGAQVTAGTLLTNILGAQPLPVEAAWEAADLAGIGDDIRAMPMQMSTTVPEGGSGFSGGQLQRILLARALVRKPKILLLDEATSALDNETQKLVSEHLDQLGMTRIVVAHRLSTVRDADAIVVLDRGRVVETGTFDELMAAGGLFSSLARRQLL